MKAMKEAKAKGGKKKEQESFVEKWVNFDTKGVKEVLLQIWIEPTGKSPKSQKITWQIMHKVFLVNTKVN